MTKLHPTPTRIYLLRNIAEGNLRWTERKGFTLHSTAINAKLDELEHAGWVRIFNAGNRQTAAITEAGHVVLDDHPAAS